MSSIKLAWASAEVEEATLTVTLEGDPPKDWKQSFEQTAKLLRDGEWGEVRLKKGCVRVSDVAPGTEEQLRHHLESIVAQANATHERLEGHNDAEDAADADGKDGEDGDGEGRDGPDAEMTERFRAFAEPSEEDDT